MKYAKVVEDSIDYDFVFYEVKKRQMHVFCPNCGRESVHPIQHSVKYTKENVMPCDCFELYPMHPKFCHAGKPWNKLNRVRTAAEFAVEDGKLVLNGYDVVAHFGEDYYPRDFGNVFYRFPVYEHRPIFRVEFLQNGKLNIRSCITVGMWGCIGRGNWYSTQKLSALKHFDLIEESFDELKNTEYETYLPQMKKYKEALSNEINVQAEHSEFTIAFLQRIRHNVSFQKLWNAGYEKLCVNRTLRDLSIGCYGYSYAYVVNGYEVAPKDDTFINWRGKTLEKILKVNIQEADNVFAREDVTPSDIKGMQILGEYGIGYSEKNIKIAPSLGALKDSSEGNGFSFMRAVKYIRNQTKNYKGSDFGRVATEFLDNVRMIKNTNTPMTDDVVFSSNLHKMHDKMVEKDKLRLMTKKRVGIKKIANAYKILNITEGNFKLEVIPDQKRLLRYANQLHNCSASYADRIIENESVLFTITKKGAGLFMLEVNVKDIRIVQNRGLRNASAPLDVLQFANQWLDKIVRIKWQEVQKCLLSA